MASCKGCLLSPSARSNNRLEKLILIVCFKLGCAPTKLNSGTNQSLVKVCTQASFELAWTKEQKQRRFSQIPVKPSALESYFSESTTAFVFFSDSSCKVARVRCFLDTKHTHFLALTGTPNSTVPVQCPCTRSRPCDWVLKMAPGIYVHTFFVTSGGNLVLCTCCKARLLSSGVWQGKREQLSVSGTQDVDTMPLCAGTQALVLRHQVFTVP